MKSDGDYMKKLILSIFLFLTIFAFVSCKNNKKEKEYFSLWNDCDAINTLKNYVEDVTDKNSSNYIPVEDRIATFDMARTYLGE